MTENELSKIVFDCALKVHQVLGPGLLESAYEECLFYELKKTGLNIQKQTFFISTFQKSRTQNLMYFQSTIKYNF